ncbi:hypothetical protein Avbf_15997, partial [Armadillidium vulgare]
SKLFKQLVLKVLNRVLIVSINIKDFYCIESVNRVSDYFCEVVSEIKMSQKQEGDVRDLPEWFLRSQEMPQNTQEMLQDLEKNNRFLEYKHQIVEENIKNLEKNIKKLMEKSQTKEEVLQTAREISQTMEVIRKIVDEFIQSVEINVNI